MRNTCKKLSSAFLILCVIMLAAGCATNKTQPKPVAEPVLLPYNTTALHNYSLSRQYVSAGRYELAREHLLLALASVEDEEFRTRLTTDIAAVDRLIRTTR